jgi:hypothetical protein
MLKRTIFDSMTLSTATMKTIHFAGMLVLFMIPAFSFSQQGGVESALQKGSATDLGVHFAKSVDLSLPATDDTFSPDKAVEVLSTFFSENSIKGYKKVHFSSAQEGRAKYSIGELSSATGIYRITIYYNAQDKITEIRIVK